MNKFLSVLAIGSLSACLNAANTEANFLCGAQTGQPCATLSEVDGSASGSTGRTVAERPEDTQTATLSQSPLFGGKSMGAAVSMNDGGRPYQSARYRIPEKTGTLWIAPRLDDEQVLHEATYVHFVIREASWGNR